MHFECWRRTAIPPFIPTLSINRSEMFAGRPSGKRPADWRVSFKDYDVGYFDQEQKQPARHEAVTFPEFSANA